MAEFRHAHDIDLLDPADHVAELKRLLANPRPVVVIYACGCQASIDFPDLCPVHARPIQDVIRTICCEDSRPAALRRLVLQAPQILFRTPGGS